jgi:hypothetical protein
MRRMLLTETARLFSIALDLTTAAWLTSLRNLRAESLHTSLLLQATVR